ncbi:MAG: zincin-like metallopeptidase domain-containing protein [Sphingobium sp.]
MRPRSRLYSGAAAFRDQINYYRTVFHELSHPSRARHRLNRDLSGRFGSKLMRAGNGARRFPPPTSARRRASSPPPATPIMACGSEKGQPPSSAPPIRRARRRPKSSPLASATTLTPSTRNGGLRHDSPAPQTGRMNPNDGGR